MKTKIAKTIQLWIPDAMQRISTEGIKEEFLLNYLLLHELAAMCCEGIRGNKEEDLEKIEDIAKVVNLLYQEGDKYTCNAIENEFLIPIALEESPGSLALHMTLFPACLRAGYLSTIVDKLGNLSILFKN
ncbi:DUF7674 family protein [Sphingobacterium griseoflavum]|uniref:DUF7674 domain-containing protein n=1 Tax=Sphingobacterium griseoflavum TaxID=1474952 RepID=A0ABQ3HUD4_9SPHI|nr:hypothetical protein [Sphingobacterium griseoflavum]GHE35619.1 hypothetical protein GCM10017764_18640 [Sphingobacterium griseoflavum]